MRDAEHKTKRRTTAGQQRVGARFCVCKREWRSGGTRGSCHRAWPCMKRTLHSCLRPAVASSRSRRLVRQCAPQSSPPRSWLSSPRRSSPALHLLPLLRSALHLPALSESHAQPPPPPRCLLPCPRLPLLMYTAYWPVPQPAAQFAQPQPFLPLPPPPVHSKKNQCQHE